LKKLIAIAKNEQVNKKFTNFQKYLISFVQVLKKL